MKELPIFVKSTAVYGDDDRKLYRYRLTRVWDDTLARVCFLMLNPSTATEFVNDPTVAKCMKYAERWVHGKYRFGSFDVVNLFAYRATDPKDMLRLKGDEAIGQRNDAHIIYAAQSAKLIICAWGNDGRHLGRADAVVRLLCDHDLSVLKINGKTGQPGHPLYLKDSAEPWVWRYSA